MLNISRKIKIIAIVILILGGVLVGLLFTGDNTNVLDYNSVFGFKTVNIVGSKGRFVEISGLCGHSAFFVKKIVEEKYKNEITVKIYLTLHKFGKSASGGFDHKIKIDDGTENIYFGNEKHLIWSKN
ncbi:MAG: hypothetical protein A2231_12455 [Candidatus Firestonebacteria bacterium RIFOXYA2_FULL_40_8]|nr:MAG: hypothetical protein A2231_12455 [Candidatus Firestonebacteria bacterium RIFOXYA2_FULL_40_8]